MRLETTQEEWSGENERTNLCSQDNEYKTLRCSRPQASRTSTRGVMGPGTQMQQLYGRQLSS